MWFVEFARKLVQLTKKRGFTVGFMQVPTCCPVLQFHFADTPLKLNPPLPPPRRWENVSGKRFSSQTTEHKIWHKTWFKNTIKEYKLERLKYRHMSFCCTILSIAKPKSTHSFPERLSPSFESKQNQLMKCISNIRMFSWTIFNNILIYLMLQRACRRILMGESTNKYVRFDMFCLSFFFLLWRIVSLEQPACMFLICLLLISHTVWQKTPESECKKTKAVKCNTL